MRGKLSAIIITRNEEERVEECIRSVSFVDEIIVIDSGSKDKTVDIAKKLGAKVISFPKGSFSEIRNKGAKEAKGDWILYVDADERVTPSLHDEISQLVNKSISQFSAFAIPRRNIILEKEMKHGGWWPDYAKRLFRKDRFKKWVGELHEEPVFAGELGHLKNPLIHLKHDNLSDMIEKTNEWSEIEARLMYEANHPSMNILRFFTAMFREFWLRMIKYRAFLDGPEGVIYAIYQMWSRFVSYAKLWEMQLESQMSKVKSQK